MEKKGKSDDAVFLPTLVPGMDKMITNGGIRRGDVVVIRGESGSGKSIFCFQSLYNAALGGENVVYICFGESSKKVKENMKSNFGLDIEKLEGDGKFKLIDLNPSQFASEVEEALAKNKAGMEQDAVLKLPSKVDRVVLDSLSAVSDSFTHRIYYREYLDLIFSRIEAKNAIGFAIVERGGCGDVSEGPENYMADGVFVLYNLKKEKDRVRALEVTKLRCSNHLKNTVPFKITDRGIEVYPKESVF
ncbi:MAG: hypothetical protein NT130_02235 [Candidatus Micrarchaeota archaeon]|nr:hypothetical protein [Candidatus Micrarchaeota archaeon]